MEIVRTKDGLVMAGKTFQTALSMLLVALLKFVPSGAVTPSILMSALASGIRGGTQSKQASYLKPMRKKVCLD
jgi:hypothetical protein